VENKKDLILDGKLNPLWPYTFSLVVPKIYLKMCFTAEDKQSTCDKINSLCCNLSCNFTKLQALKSVKILLNFQKVTLMSGFCHDVHEICALLGYYAASCGNCHMTPRNIPEEHRFQKVISFSHYM
jgi:hypothetical protein